MYIDVKTNTDPPTLTVAEAARQARCSKVYITNKIGDDTLDYGYAYYIDEDNHGQKVVIKNQKWKNFLETTKNSKRKREDNLWISKDVARYNLGVSDGALTQMLIEGELEFDFKTNKIKKDDSYYRLLKETKNAN